MVGHSKAELVAWLRERPRTLGWGAVLAFNRTDTNTVLLQEYIERFSTQHYLPPVEGYVTDVDARPQFITGYTLDYPRLSFEIANIEDDIPDARLTMQVVGGTQVTYEKSSAGLIPWRIEVVDPLNGPSLTLRLHLVDVPGTVNSAGQVVLDLSRSSDFSLSYSDYLAEELLGGLFFQKLFEDLPDDQRIMVLSEIKQVADNPIKPASLKLRTQAAPGAKVRSADNYGDGAVLVFVAMEGEPSGGNPDATYRYLIPDDAQKAYGATVLLGNKLLLDKVMGAQLVKHYDVIDKHWGLVPDEKGFLSLQPEGRMAVFKMVHYSYESRGVTHAIPNLDFNDQTIDVQTRINILDDRVRMHAVRASDYFNVAVEVLYPGVGVAQALQSVKWDLMTACKYTLNKELQQLEPSFPEPLSVQWDYSWFEFSGRSNSEVAMRAFEANKEKYTGECNAFFNEACQGMLHSFPPIDAFVLQSLLFRSKKAVVLDDMVLPGDMAIFGWVDPSRTRFSIAPLQALIGLNETIQFTTHPTQTSGVSWAVSNIPGSTGDPGTISNGEYKAPSSMNGTFTRVRVTATTANATSSALVSVVVNDISVGPQIQMCAAGFGCKLSAGSRGNGTLRWSLRTPANGGDLNPDSGSSKYVYTAPEKADGKTIIVDEIVVTNELTGKSKSARVAVIFGSSLVIVQDRSVSLPAGQARLRVFREGQEVDATLLTWEVLAGSGTVTEGVFTQPVELEDRFALVHAFIEYPGFGTFNGYTLLPLPLLGDPTGGTPGLSFMAV